MPIVWILIAVQAVLAVRVLTRMLRSARGVTILPDAGADVAAGSVSIVVPVLDEVGRLGPCLERLISASGPEVREILVVDGGSTDGTPSIVRSYGELHSRVRLVDAAPVPTNWNGKAWGLATGLAASSPGTHWIATVDADVRVEPGLLRAVVHHAQHYGVPALSVALEQDLGDAGSGFVHPAMLTTLVYRYGLPGHATTNVRDVQANGQCFVAERALLAGSRVFERARTSVCEDVTAARLLARDGRSVGFYEAGNLGSVRMYDRWQDVWRNWPRSLTLRDGVAGSGQTLGLAEIVAVQALPLAIVVLLELAGHAQRPLTILLALNVVLLMMRVGVLAGTRRAYRNPPWTYWLSMVADLPVAAALILSALRKRHTWRGRLLVVSERIT